MVPHSHIQTVSTLCAKATLGVGLVHSFDCDVTKPDVLDTSVMMMLSTKVVLKILVIVMMKTINTIVVAVMV